MLLDLTFEKVLLISIYSPSEMACYQANDDLDV